MSEASRLELRATLDDLGRVRDFVEASLGALALGAEPVGEMVLAVDEAVSNVILHGSAGDAAHIEIQVLGAAQAVIVQLRDDGVLFDPTRQEDRPLGESPLQREAPGGYGLPLLRRLVDRIDYRVCEDGRNELTLVKRRPGSAAVASRVGAGPIPCESGG